VRMVRLSLLLATAGLTVAIVAFPGKADALGPVDVEIGARAGVTPGPLGRLGVGIGGRGGVSILGRLYAGIDVIDYLGATATCGGCSWPSGAMPVEQWRSALLYGFEGGYNFKISRVTIRPQLGLGDLRLSAWYGGFTAGAISNVTAGVDASAGARDAGARLHDPAVCPRRQSATDRRRSRARACAASEGGGSISPPFFSAAARPAGDRASLRRRAPRGGLRGGRGARTSGASGPEARPRARRSA